MKICFEHAKEMKIKDVSYKAKPEYPADIFSKQDKYFMSEKEKEEVNTYQVLPLFSYNSYNLLINLILHINIEQLKYE